MPHKDPKARAAYQRARYQKDPSGYMQKQREWREANPEKWKAIARKTARKCQGKVSPEHVTGETKSGSCEICGDEKVKLDFDHDHKSGKFRGWLCRRCNMGLGSFRDNPAFLQSAIEYLNRTSE